MAASPKQAAAGEEGYWASQHLPRTLFPEDPQRITLNVFNTSAHPPKAMTDGLECDLSVGRILANLERKSVIEAVAYNGGVLDVRVRGEEGWSGSATGGAGAEGASPAPKVRIKVVSFNRNSETSPMWAEHEEETTVAGAVTALEGRSYVLSVAYVAGAMDAVVLGHKDGWDQRGP